MYIVVILDFKMPHQSYHQCPANVRILSHYHNFIIYPLGIHHDHHIVNIIVTSLYISPSQYHCTYHHHLLLLIHQCHLMLTCSSVWPSLLHFI